MTSKNLFFNLMKEDFKRRLWTAALSFLVFFFSLPVASAMVTARWSESIKTDPGLYLNMVHAVQSCLGLNNGFMGVIIVLASLIFGVNSFSWLHSKQKVDFYHSIPVRREKLFLVNYLDGILIPLAAYALNLVLALVVVMVNGISAGDVLLTSVSAFGFFMLHYAMMYSVTVLAMIMTGNIIVGILGTGVFHFYFPCLLLVVEGLFDIFFRTSYRGTSGVAEKLIDKCSAFTLFIGNYSIMDSTRTTGECVIRLLAAAAVTVIVTILSLVLYKKRGSEAAGKAMAFKWSKPLVRIPIVILSALLGSMFFWSMRSSLGWAIFGVICGLVLSHCVIEIIYHFDFKKLFSHRIQMAVCGVAALAVFLGFRYDLFGYDSYLPSQSSVQSMAVSFGDIEYWVDYGSAEKAEQDTYLWKGVPKDEYIFDHTEFSEAETAAARLLVSKAVEQVHEKRLTGSERGWREDERYLSFSVRYELKNGREVYRSYNVSGEDLYQDFLLLYDTEAYRRASLPVMNQTPQETAVAVIQTDAWSKDADRDVTARLLQTYQKEMVSITSSQMMHENPIAEIQFLTPVQEDAKKALGTKKSSSAYSSVVERGYYPIYPSFTETIAILEESGIVFDPPITPEEIQLISVEAYQLDSFLNDEEDAYYDKYEAVIEVTDKDEIAELMKNAVSGSYSHMNAIREKENKIHFDVITGNGVNRSGRRSGYSYSILLEEAPEFLIEMAKEKREDL